MEKNSEHRIEFRGKRKEQTNAHPSYRIQAVKANSYDEAVDKLKQKYTVKEIY